MQTLKEQYGYIPNSVESTIEVLESVRKQISELKEVEEDLKKQLVEDFADKLKLAYKEKSEPFGIVNFKEGDYTISFTTPKNVKWDQKGMAELYREGAPVDVEYSISETLYKSFDEPSQEAFMPYRTVKPGAINIKMEKK